MDRRTFLKTGAILGASATAPLTAANTVRAPTPHEVEGPFYPVVAMKDQDFDLTRIQGQTGQAKGAYLDLIGSVVDTRNQPVEDATIEIWQANAAGRYRHPHDPSSAPLDQNFQGWAIVPSGEQGGFRFKTVFPGAYPAGRGWQRPPHIHFKVTKRGYEELITQMYFPDQTLNAKDLLLQRKSPEEQERMIAQQLPGEPATYRYQLVIEKIADR